MPYDVAIIGGSYAEWPPPSSFCARHRAPLRTNLADDVRAAARLHRSLAFDPGE